MVGWEQVKSQK